MSLTANKARIAGLTKEFLARWEQTKETWQDAKSREFEQKYLEELQASVDKTVTIIDQLEKLLNKVRNDCE
jgi:thymidylate synthase